jgi:hypothetical protein
VVDLSPAKIVGAIKALPPLTIADYVEKHFAGQAIRASGTIRDLYDPGGPYVTVSFKDDSGVEISANFTKPLTPKVKLLSKGDRVELVGKVFNVAADLVVLDDCTLSKAMDQSTIRVIVSHEKKWWGTWWGILILGIVASLIAALIVWMITSHFDKRSPSPSSPATTEQQRKSGRDLAWECSRGPNTSNL